MNTLTMKRPQTPVSQKDPRWKAVAERDARADGNFYYSVKTTGIYCRPSCAARLPRPENVAFHATPEEAEQAGFRPCLRCRPREESAAQKLAAKVSQVCRWLESSEEIPTLEELAKSVDLSVSHFHRSFKTQTGLTPREYAVSQREQRMRDSLDRSHSVTQAIYDAGYGSDSRFYERSQQTLGMTPTAYRAGGKDTAIRFAVAQCSLGSVLIAQSDRGVCAIALGDNPEVLVQDLQDRFSQATLAGDDREFSQQVAQVVAFVEAPKTGLDLPLDIQGTAFQRRVWQALCSIPAGETLSYSELAQRLGAPKSSRAVAAACAANTLAVAVPCHRIVRNDGSLSGYRWGVERKRALLEREDQEQQ